MKRCSQCGQLKPLSQFWRRKLAPDGHQYACKDCQRALTRTRQQAQPKRHRQRVRVSRAKRTARGDNEQEPDREKRLARKRLAYAVERGHIVRPSHCEKCGRRCRPHGHHKDHSKPLDVDWLCAKCHRAEHNPYNQEKQQDADSNT